MVTDIAEHLSDPARRLDAIVNNTMMAIFVMDQDQQCVFANKAAERLTGYSFAEMQGRPLHDVIHHKHPDGRHYPLEDCPIDRAFPERAQMQGEEMFVHKDGSFFPVAFTASPINGDDGMPIGTIIEAKNIAEEQEQRRALETLNQTGQALAAEVELERIVQMVTEGGVKLTGAQFGAFFYNEVGPDGEKYALYTLYGAERSQFERFGMPRATEVFAPTFKGEGIIRSDDILSDSRYGKSDPHFGMPRGHLPVRSYLAVPVQSRDGEVIGGLFFGHPEPARFKQHHEELMSGIAAHAAIAVDNARLYGELKTLNETLGRRVEEAIAERAAVEDALRQAQKMEAVGQLTGGIAHDFNNLLAGISGSLEIIERKLAQGRTEGIEKFIAGAQTSAQRAAALTQRLLAFSRRQTLDPKPTDVNRLVLGMEDLIRRTVGPSIKVEVVGAAGLWPVKVDAAQLESALLNLSINARDALPQGGRITIETANKWLDGRAGAERDLTPGQYISICVTDSGTGIPKDIVDRIFDPFFTTKPIGQGTGLGLSMIHGFVRQSGGQVRVYTEEGDGTTMCLYLPRYTGTVEQDQADEHGTIYEAGAGETVLVIDDEPTVRMLIVEVLEEAGYKAIEAEDGPSGLKILAADVRIDLLITDVGLPGGMNGRQVADAARTSRPDLKVLFVTGFAENAAVGNGHLEPGMEVITKPFVMVDLANKITEMIEG
jgi:PAS domain S-box-containing protein